MTLTVGSPTMIDTDEITTLGEELARVSLECGMASAEASAARVMTVPPNPSAQWSTAGSRIERAADQLAAASDQAAAVSRALGASASLYLETEATVSSLFNVASSATGAVGGVLFGHMVLPLVGATALVAGPSLIALSTVPGAGQVFSRAKSVLGTQVTGWLAAHPSVARSPLTMLLVRGLVSGSDDTVKTALGMPPGLSVLINDPRLSVPGVAVGLGALGVPGLGESPVAVTPVTRSIVAAPRSISDLATRIPDASPGSPQIRIEEYGDGDSWVVYVGGTVDSGLGGGDEAFDMESNASLMADVDGGAYRAVEQAMEEAGIGADEPVTIVGHSQGGLVAERVTQSGDYNVKTLVTFGAPSTGAELPDGVDAYAVEHSGDVVPALGGFTDGGDRIVVTGDAPPGGDDWLAAHSMSGYEQTATQMDESFDPRFGPLRSTLDAMGGEGTSTDYQAVRIDEQIPPNPGDAAPDTSPTDTAGPSDADHSSGRTVRPQDADLRIDPVVPDNVPQNSDAPVGSGGSGSLLDDRTGRDVGHLGGNAGDHVLDDGEHDESDGLHEAVRADGPRMDRSTPQPSPLPMPDKVIRP